MQVPNTASLVFLGYILVLLPWAAVRSARRLRAAWQAGATAAIPSRRIIWASMLVMQAMLLLLTWQTGRTVDYRIFAVPALAGWDGAMAAVALVACLALRAVARAAQLGDERWRMTVCVLAPRTPGETALLTATALAASVAEEAAYRGVGLAILWHSFGSPWPAVIVLATAFAGAHWVQGWKSGVVIFVIALVFHALVALTGTLVLAMGVHAVYDLIAAALTTREARQYDAETPATASPFS